MIYRLLRKLFAISPRQTASARTFQVRPTLEHLEDRTLMATSVFQAAGSTFPGFGENPNGPALIFKIGPGGSVTTINNGTGPYDGSDDTYVGVVNQAGSGTVVTKLALTSSSSIFGFEADGIQDGSTVSPFPPVSYSVPHSAPAGYVISGYEGPGTFFTNINSGKTNGTVHFDDGLGHGLLPGKQAFFSLEEAPDEISINVKVAGAGLAAQVFFPFRPNFARPSSNVLGWVKFTNNGPDITGSFTVAVRVPGVGVQLLGATVNGAMVSSSILGNTITIHGLKHGQTEAILARFTYPSFISLDGIRKLLRVEVP